MSDTDDIEADAPAAADHEPASWRQLDPHLWVGHEGTTSLGTIEHGARFVFIDADGAPHPGVESLRDAQMIATGAIRLPMPSAAEPPTATRRRVVLRAAIVIAGFALVLVAAWLLARALLIG